MWSHLYTQVVGVVDPPALQGCAWLVSDRGKRAVQSRLHAAIVGHCEGDAPDWLWHRVPSGLWREPWTHDFIAAVTLWATLRRWRFRIW